MNSANAKSVTVKAKWTANCASGTTIESINLSINVTKTLTYSGKTECLLLQKIGKYKFELWGASGGQGRNQNKLVGTQGLGGYVQGTLSISESKALYAQIGQVGYNAIAYARTAQAYNGGGAGDHDHQDDEASGGGGGATDIRLSSLAWNNAESLNSRIMVAAGGGGGGYYKGTSHAGGLSGYHDCPRVAETNQTTGNAFGIGAERNEGIAGSFGIGGGGGGYYGGTTSTRAQDCSGYNSGYDAGTGGSSYISGHTGSVAIAEGSTSNPRAVKISGCTTGTTNNDCSIHYSGIYFTNTVMIDGYGYVWTNTKGSRQVMPNPTTTGNYSSGIGHTGNGYIRITYLGT